MRSTTQAKPPVGTNKGFARTPRGVRARPRALRRAARFARPRVFRSPGVGAVMCAWLLPLLLPPHLADHIAIWMLVLSRCLFWDHDARSVDVRAH